MAVQYVNEILNPFGMLEHNWSNRMLDMDVQLLLLYLSPVFLAFVGWEMLYLRNRARS